MWRYADDHQTDSDDESANSSIIDNDCDEYGRGKRLRRPVDRLDLKEIIRQWLFKCCFMNMEMNN